MTLITNDRLEALSRINRWGGWVKWDYSVLDHTIIGAIQLKSEGLPYKPFLLHDFEESEFGDVISPVKDLIPPGSVYHTRVARFNQRLVDETGVIPDGGDMDIDMAHAEHLTVAIRGDKKFDARPITPRVAELVKWIERSIYMRGQAMTQWWKLWNAT